MLSNLRVQNFAIIDNISIEFFEGFTVLTGETGAGKSLIIDAIGLLFGDRSISSIVRSGESKAIVEGVFEKISDNTKKVLEEIGVDLLDDDLLIIKREINVNGKNIIRVNGEMITLNQLESLAFTLGDIHTQDDTKKLFLPENYLTFVENDETLKLLESYRELLAEYKEKLKRYQNLLNEQTKTQTNKDFWEFQYNELVNADLKENEIENLEKEVEYLSNFETIYNLLGEIKETFEENNLTTALYNILTSFNKLVSYNNKYQKYLDTINDSYYNLDDFYDFIRNEYNHLEFDEETLDRLNERISYLKNLSHKYRMNISELISYRNDLEKRLDVDRNLDVYLEDSLNDVKKSFKKLADITNQLTIARKNNANKLVHNIKNTLKDLLLNRVEVVITFNEYQLDNPLNATMFKDDGCDKIDILVSFNVGESPKPLSKIASGGEMSRVMLALKVNLLNNLHLSTMIFDEIDSGISGEAAEGVARKMKEISNNTQVLAITHLPIVASFASTQMLISKKVVDDRTITSIKTLDHDERILVLAKMISPNDQTNKSIELARSWLEK